MHNREHKNLSTGTRWYRIAELVVCRRKGYCTFELHQKGGFSSIVYMFNGLAGRSMILAKEELKI
jgi:hypothetical protein